MKYAYYQDSRNLSWKVLIHCGVVGLPVNLNTICKHYCITTVPYSKFEMWDMVDPKAKNGDGFSMQLGDSFIIVYNDTIPNIRRIRFTIAHELGHILLGHVKKVTFYRNSEIDNPSDPNEMQATIFARDILAPATVLAALNIHSADEIVALCDISFAAAQIRANRMEELYKRNMFDKHPLERQVRKQFDTFINLHIK